MFSAATTALLLSAASLVPAVHAASDAAAAAHMIANQLLHAPAVTARAAVAPRDSSPEDQLLSIIPVPSACYSDLAFITDAPLPDAALSSYLVSATDPCFDDLPQSLYDDVSSYSDVLFSWASSHIDESSALYDCIGTAAPDSDSVATIYEYECGVAYLSDDGYFGSATGSATATDATSSSSVTKSSASESASAKATTSTESHSAVSGPLSTTSSAAAASSSVKVPSGADRVAFGSFTVAFLGVLAAAVAL